MATTDTNMTPPANETRASTGRGRRWLKIIAIVLLGLIALLLLLVFVVPKTGPGKGVIDDLARPIIEEQVQAQLGSEIEFDRISGALPGELILNDITLSDEGSPWLTVERVALDWSPLSLIKGNIVVESLVVTNADLLRKPPPVPEKPEQPQEDSGPLDLPSIDVRRVAILPLTIREPVLGTAYALNAEVSAKAAGQDIAAKADISTVSGTDAIAVDVDYDPETLRADVRITGDAEGLLATLAKTDGPVQIVLAGDGPLTSWRGQLDAALGAYGGAEAVLSGDLEGLQNARFTGRITPGAGLPPVAGQVIGEALTLDVGTARDGEALLVTIDEASGRFGDLGGTIRLGSLAADTVDADLSGSLSENVATEFGVPFLAGPLALDADAAQANGGWTFDAALTANTLTARVTDGLSNAEMLFSGLLDLQANSLQIGQDRVDPILAGGVSAKARVTYPTGGTIEVREIDVATGRDTQRVTLGGRADFNPDTTQFKTDIDATLRKGALERIAGTGAYDGSLTLDLTASGTPENAAVRLNAAIPSGVLDGVAFSSGQLTTDVAGLPTSPNGTVKLTSTDGDYAGEVVARSDGPVISVPQLAFSSNGLSLNGDAAVNTETKALQANVTLDAGNSATLITGQTVGGKADIRADIGGDGGPVDIAVTAESLNFEGNRIDSANVTATGPLNAVKFDISARGLSAADQFLAFIDAGGSADVATPQRVVELASLKAGLSDEEEDHVTLLDPVTIELGEVISVSRTRLDWLAGGTIALEGRYAPELWVAEVEAQGISVPQAPLLADLALSVDSRRDEVANFALTAKTTDDELEDIYVLAATGTWAGDRLSANAELAPDGGARLGRADVSFPLILTRTSGALGVEIPEEGLDGRVTYASDIAPLYAFAAMQGQPLTGQLNADVQLAGALKAPEATGQVRLADGRFEEEQFGFLLQDIGLEADFSYTGTETVATLSGSASDANGDANAVDLTGDVRLGADASSVDVRVALNDAQLSDTAALELQSSGELALTGPLTDLLFAGRIQIDELDAAIPDLGGDEAAPEYVTVDVVRVDGQQVDRVGELEEAPPPPFEIALDLAIEANNAVFVRGRGLESEWSIDMTVAGSTIAPRIGGEIRLLDGTFDFAGREFDLTQGVIDFQNRAEVNPRLDIEAQYDTGDVTAIIGVTGEAQSPEIELSSNPDRPQEDIMALILFGKQPTDLTALESLQIANAVAKLTGTSPLGGGGPGMQDKLRSSLGLDALSLGVGDDGNASVGVGKYVTDDIYVSARQSVGDVGTEVIVTYEVTDDITVESALKPDGAQGVSANYKRDY